MAAVIPHWLSIISVVSLAAAACCAGAVAIDIARGNRQHMAIMNVVWPVTALWSGVLGLWGYFRIGRRSPHLGAAGGSKPFWQAVAISASHWGAGCALGDILSEWVHHAAPFTIAGSAMLGAWTLDYACAFLIGIAFQYFAIAPMRHLPVAEGLRRALKADSLSLTSWQAGMYGWMALARFAIFGREIPVTSPAFWFLMQIGMAAGFLTSYPVNWWLVRSGIKEKM